MILNFGDVSISLSNDAKERALKQILRDMLYEEAGYEIETGLKEGKDIEYLKRIARHSATKLWEKLLPEMLDIANELVDDCKQDNDNSVPF